MQNFSEVLPVVENPASGQAFDLLKAIMKALIMVLSPPYKLVNQTIERQAPCSQGNINKDLRNNIEKR